MPSSLSKSLRSSVHIVETLDRIWTAPDFTYFRLIARALMSSITINELLIKMRPLMYKERSCFDWNASENPRWSWSSLCCSPQSQDSYSLYRFFLRSLLWRLVWILWLQWSLGIFWHPNWTLSCLPPYCSTTQMHHPLPPTCILAMCKRMLWDKKVRSYLR